MEEEFTPERTGERLTRLDTVVATLATSVEKLTSEFIVFKDTILNKGKPTGQLIISFILAAIAILTFTASFVHFYVSNQIMQVNQMLIYEKDLREKSEERIENVEKIQEARAISNREEELRQNTINTEQRVRYEFQKEHMSKIDDTLFKLTDSIVAIQSVLVERQKQTTSP